MKYQDFKTQEKAIYNAYRRGKEKGWRQGVIFGGVVIIVIHVFAYLIKAI